MGGEARVVDPVDLRVALQELSDGHRVLRVALHPEVQRLETLQKEEAVERAERRAVVPEHLDTSLQDKGELAQSRVDLEPVVGGVGIGESGELAVIPGKLSAVHDHAAYAG